MEWRQDNFLCMKTLKIPYVWIAVIVFAASIIGVGFWKLGKLHEYRAFIESEYRSQLSAIEFAMKSEAFPVNDEADFEDYERRKAARNKLAASFPEVEVFFIWWSSDGHHGIESLKDMPCSEVRTGLLSSTDAAGSHKLRLASGSDGTSLISV
jgi:hypothetical protein